MTLQELVSEVEKYGTQQTVEEDRENLEVMGIEPDLFTTPIGTKRITVLVPQDYEDDGDIPDVDGIDKEGSVRFVFDFNREAYVWRTEKGILLYVSSDGKAEAGYTFYRTK